MTAKQKDRLQVAARILVASAIFAAILLNYDTLRNLDVRQLVAGASGVYTAGLIVLLVYLVKSVLFVIPAMIIYVSVGMAFPVGTALLINLLGLTLEVTVTYFLGRFLGGDAVEKKLSGTKGGQRLLNMKPKHKFFSYLAVRALPVFPIDFASLFFGASHENFLSYLLFSVVGIFPRIALFTIFGDAVQKYFSPKVIFTLILIALPIGVVAWLINHYRKGKKGKETTQTETE